MSAVMRPVGLTELNERAALLSRRDRKYVLDPAQASEFLQSLAPGARILTIGSRTSFRYDSVYFDTTGLDCYLAAARGREYRAKVRVRHYVETGGAFLEVKTRAGGSTIKRRIPHDPHRLLEITPDQYSFVEECLKAGRVSLKARWLKPALLTSYSRRTLLPADETSRITVDDALTWRLVGGEGLTPQPFTVVETKSPGTASPADRHLWSLGHRPQRLSKYATGLAALRPSLPSNRWRRTLSTTLTRQENSHAS